MNEMEKFHRSSSGQVLLIVVITMVVALTAALTLASRTITNLKVSKQNEDSQRAFQAASAGIEKSITTGQSIGNLTNASFTTNISAASGNSILLNNGDLVPQDRGIDVWLSNYPDFSSPMNSGSISFLWGTKNAANCSATDKDSVPALEIVLLSGSKLNPTVTKYAYDACGGTYGNRRSSNNFSTPLGTSTSGGNPTPTPVACPTTGLAHYWPANESSGATVADVIGVGGVANGTIVNNVTRIVGKLGNALQFTNTASNPSDTTTAAVNMGQASTKGLDFSTSQQYSVSGWVKASPASSFQFLVADMHGAGNGNGWSISTQPDGTLLLYNVNDYHVPYQILVGGTANVRDGNWHHFAVTYDGAITPDPLVKIYVDGVQSNTGTFNSLGGRNTASVNAPFRFGAREYGNYAVYTGALDDIGIWNRALTETEVQTLYNFGNGLSCESPTPTPTPTSAPSTYDGQSVNGKTLYFKTNPIPLSNALILKVIPLYNSSVIGVVGSSGVSLPSQGKVIESVGTSGETTRKIQYFESYPQLPTEAMQYSILSQ